MNKSTKQPPVANRPKAQTRRPQEQANKRVAEQTRRIHRTHYANKYRGRWKAGADFRRAAFPYCAGYAGVENAWRRPISTPWKIIIPFQKGKCS